MVIHHWFVGSINRPAYTVCQCRFPLGLCPHVVGMSRCIFHCMMNILLPRTEMYASGFPGIVHGHACASKLHRRLQENTGIPRLVLETMTFFKMQWLTWKVT